MTDALDKAILWCLADLDARTTWEIAKQICKEATNGIKIESNDYEMRKLCNRIRYRLKFMESEGYIISNRKTGKYYLENVTIGEGKLTLKPDAEGEEPQELAVGKTVMAHLDIGTKIYFLEEI